MVGPGLSALKKATLQRRNTTVIEDEKGYMALETTEEEFTGIPIGWQILMKDRKITHDYQAAHPTHTETDLKSHFVKSLEDGLRMSLLKVAAYECLYQRLAHMEDFNRNHKLFIDCLTQSTGFLVGGIEFIKEGTMLSKLFWAETQLSANQNLCLGAQDIIMSLGRSQLSALSQEAKKLCAYHSTACFVSNIWRVVCFPQTSQEEIDRLSKTNRFLPTFLRRSIPGGFIFEQLYRTAEALATHREAIFKIE